MEINQFLFVQALSESDAIEAADTALVDCPWALAWDIDEAAIVNGASEDFERIIMLCAAEQIKSLRSFLPYIHEDGLALLAEEHDPMTTWDDGGSQVVLLGVVADIISGAVWSPWSAGFDVVTGRADYAALLDRHDANPAAQWAIPVIVEPVE